ncbi:MAG: biotin--[acetyl-CoA-carboxylase] ligase [Actinomycetota bacterium]|nr:biotin--[acetyl-CoA-carboxylase] ligase [Actinomycetota bacterium]
MLDDSARRVLRDTRFSDVRWYPEVTSTNSVLVDLARQGAQEGVVVVADHQTAGRGRRGRTWEAEPGTSLLVSVLLRPRLPADTVPLLTLMGALAASDACEEVAGVAPLLKWPNDLVVADGVVGDGVVVDGVVGDGKVGGVLGETVAAAAVLGIGLNVKAGATLPPGGLALEAAAGRPVDRSALLVALLRNLETRYQGLRSPGGSERLLTDYRARSATIGRAVRVEVEGGTREGSAVDLTPEGHLVIDTGSRREVVRSGDVVHLRQATPLTGAAPGSGPRSRRHEPPVDA